VSGLRRTTEVIEHREGGDPSASRKSPGRTHYDPITLERGVTHDTAFETWANRAWHLGAAAGAETALADFRKDIIVDFFNEAGQKVLSYKVYRCWVSEYMALPDLDADSSAVAIEVIRLENEGWERDHTVVEPLEPS
jgi:phage tail-like protein